MSFEEKIDAMRMTLELAMHDIEAQRAAIQELRMLSASQYDSINALSKISGDLVQTAQAHDQGISGLEGRR
jgi:hypothetical protein